MQALATQEKQFQEQTVSESVLHRKNSFRNKQFQNLFYIGKNSFRNKQSQNLFFLHRKNRFVILTRMYCYGRCITFSQIKVTNFLVQITKLQQKNVAMHLTVSLGSSLLTCFSYLHQTECYSAKHRASWQCGQQVPILYRGNVH